MNAGFVKPVIVDISQAAPYHFGISLTKEATTKEA